MDFTFEVGPKRMLDYRLVSTCLLPAVRRANVVTQVPWQTHFGISIALSVVPEQLFVNELVLPKPLPGFLAEFAPEKWQQAERIATVKLANPKACPTFPGSVGKMDLRLALQETSVPNHRWFQQLEISGALVC